MQPRLLRSPARLAGSSLLRLQSDDRLVALARDGHEQAFAAIVERYRGPLERYAGRIGGAERAEDAVQQAFVSAHAALISDPERHIELRPWLYRIVHNSTLNLLRSAHDDAPLEAAAMAALGDDAVERRARLREALDAVSALPAVQRDAILLRELEGRSHEEIATTLGVSPGAARQHLFRARNALRAAVTAITPQPLLERLLFAASGASGAPGAADLAAAGGASALLAKATAGVLATGAIVGGAVGSGVVHAPRHSHRHAAITRSVDAAAPASAAAAPVVAARPEAGHATVGDEHRRGRTSSGSSSAGDRRHGRRESGDDHRGPSSSSSGSSDGGSSGGGPGDDGSGRHGSTSGSSGDDGGHSGSGSSSGSGDGGRTAGTLSTSGDDGGSGGSTSTSGDGGSGSSGSSGSTSGGDGRSGGGDGSSDTPTTTSTTATTTTDDHSGSDGHGG